ncbi:MAG: MinD/ParA family protein [Actinomycetes bacterium]
MLTVLWSPKGGVGVSVVAAALAVAMAEARSSVDRSQVDRPSSGAERDMLLVDPCGDQPSVLGLARPSGPGLRDWAATPDRDPAALGRLTVPVVEGLRLLPAGDGPPLGRTAAQELVAALAGSAEDVVVDVGAVRRCGAVDPLAPLVEAADHSLMVVRPCYLALRAGVAAEARPDGVVVVEEPGRALVSRDVADVLAAPVMATVPLDPAVARAVDAGVLARRLPRVLAHAFKDLV